MAWIRSQRPSGPLLGTIVTFVPPPHQVTVIMRLTDAEEMHRLHPTTFHLPPLSERTTLRAGDLAQVCFGGEERMWVLISAVNPGPVYVGELNNIPIVMDMKLGQAVTFEPRHVYQTDFLH